MSKSSFSLRLQKLTPIRGRKLMSEAGSRAIAGDCLQKLTPIRGRKLSPSILSGSIDNKFTETNPDKGTETHDPLS